VTDDATFEEPAPPRCPACLAPIEPGQQFCLACGERLTPAGTAGDPLRPTGRPPAAIAIAVGLLLLLIGGFGIAYGFTRDDGEGSTVAAATTHTTAGNSAVPPTASSSVAVPTFTSVPASTAVPTFSTDSVPTFSTVTTSPTSTTTPTTTSTPTSTAAEKNDWPPGKDGYAVLLMSRDSEQFDYAYITQQKATAESKGLTNVGVLNSDDYFTLNPGYWVLYMGPYDTKSQAQAAVSTAVSKGYSDAYVRRVAE
jgi:hypothetical protein